MPSSITNFQRSKLKSFVPDESTVINLENIAVFCKAAFPERYDILTPVSGDTVTIVSKQGNDVYNCFTVISPAANLAALTIDFPEVSTCLNGQEIALTFTKNITTVTMNGNGATIILPIATIGLNQTRLWKFVSGTWYLNGRY